MVCYTLNSDMVSVFLTSSSTKINISIFFVSVLEFIATGSARLHPELNI